MCVCVIEMLVTWMAETRRQANIRVAHRSACAICRQNQQCLVLLLSCITLGSLINSQILSRVKSLLIFLIPIFFANNSKYSFSLDVAQTGHVACPYCGTKYKLKAGEVIGHHH
ncbi:MAG: hypothetical protein B7Y34_03980 [Methylophilales bacterium 16-45-9]|nr:MAG: hypothetical protein B7Y34_03980 [Methylophilales bacterium 16-45-9]